MNVRIKPINTLTGDGRTNGQRCGRPRCRSLAAQVAGDVACHWPATGLPLASGFPAFCRLAAPGLAPGPDISVSGSPPAVGSVAVSVGRRRSHRRSSSQPGGNAAQ